MLDVTPLSVLNLMPSGGVSPDNAEAWWDAGAAIIGMGSNLVGKDIAKLPGTQEYDVAASAWASSGKAVAQGLFDKVVERAR